MSPGIRVYFVFEEKEVDLLAYFLPQHLRCFFPHHTYARILARSQAKWGSSVQSHSSRNIPILYHAAHLSQRTKQSRRSKTCNVLNSHHHATTTRRAPRRSTTIPAPANLAGLCIFFLVDDVLRSDCHVDNIWSSLYEA